ncbi:MAG TPA: hypothetical protein VF832_16780 [Longimicrobiales bacterium]
MPSTVAFLRQYLRPLPGAVVEEPAACFRGNDVLPATMFRPAQVRRPLPGWVILHGLTYHGKEHPSLLKFCRAVAASGAVVCVPDIPEWKTLHVAPAVTGPSILAGAEALRARQDVAPERVGVIGFSFGATQALTALARDPVLASEIRGIAAWGGYADVRRLFRFGITGNYDWNDVAYHADPDPYGRWVMGGNYVTAVPGFEDAGPLAAALHRLAIAAGKAGVYAADAQMDPYKVRERAQLSPKYQELFDLFAPLTTQPHPDMARAAALSVELADAAVRADPLLDPTPDLPHVPTRTFIAHGRDDRLVPFTESLRLARALPAGVLRSVTVTSLFSHSGGTTPDLGPIGVAREAGRFVRLLRGILALI